GGGGWGGAGFGGGGEGRVGGGGHGGAGEEGCGEGSPAVGHERQRDAGRRQEADHHRGVDRHGKEEDPREGEDQEDSPAVPRGPRERQTSQNERREEPEHGDDPEEPPLLSDHREDEVGVLDRQEAQLALRPRPETLPRKSSGPHGDLGLGDLVAGLQDVPVGIQERLDPILLVVLQEEPAGARESRNRDRDGDPSLERQPAEEKPDDEQRKERQRQPEIRLSEGQEERDADDRPELDEGRESKPPLLLVLEEIGDEQRRRDLGQLRRLELEAPEADPRAHVGDALAEDDQVNERHETDEVEDERRLQQRAVVEEHGGEHSQQPN